MFIDAIVNCIFKISISNFSLVAYRTTHEFYILNMNPVTLINSLISSSTLSVLGLSIWTIMLSVNIDNFIYSFSIYINFISFSSLTGQL